MQWVITKAEAASEAPPWWLQSQRQARNCFEEGCKNGGYFS
jgi:hypothetical protein